MSEGLQEKILGRPKSSLDLPDGWEKLFLEEYKEGASDQEIKSLIHEMRSSFSNDLWNRWLKEEVIFSETIKKGRELSHAWWLKKGRKNLENKEFSPTLWYMNMKNRWGWTDNQKVDVSSNNVNVNLNTDVDYKLLTDEELETLDKIISKASVKPD